MTHLRSRRRTAVTVALLLLGTAATVWAQAPTGNLYGTVTDNEGARLPGVTVTITGMGAPQVQVTDEQGNFRILSLDPGSYHLKAELQGYSTVEQPNIEIRVNRNTEIRVQLSAAVEEVITVSSQSPLLDERKLTTGTTVSQTELEKIPTARDPWALLNQAPGVISDRINVGGNESGQQSRYVGPGIARAENEFILDGVQVTDMTSAGASLTYFNFDQFTEVQLLTGGNDVTKATAGVGINLVTKRGTNEFRGSGNFYVTDADGQFKIFEESEPEISSSDLADGTVADVQESFTGNRINRIEDLGVELGGPLLRDRVWLWGSWHENDIQNLVPTDVPGELQADDTILENAAMKLNAQLTDANSAVASWTNGNKQKFGRDASPTHPPETTRNQRGPGAIWKAEDTHVFSSNLFLTVTWSHIDTGYSLVAARGAGDDAPRAYRDETGVWRDNGLLSGSLSSPDDQYKVDGSYFFNTGESTSHEIKFGGRYRDYQSSSVFSYPGGNVVTDLASSTPFVLARRGTSGPPINMEYTSLWVQDTITSGRLTYNIGLRYDLQEGENEPIRSRANIHFPEVMPAVEFQGAEAPFEWEDVLPRLGVTYALGEQRETLLRASFSQFASQLSATDVEHNNPVARSLVYFSNLTGEPWQPGDPVGPPRDPVNIDLSDPASIASSPNVTDPSYTAPKTTELVVGAEHAFLPEFAVGLNATYRDTDDWVEERDLVRPVGTDGVGRPATVDDYVLDEVVTGILPNGETYSVQTFSLDPALEFAGGTLLTNGDRAVEYRGLGLVLTKRLTNQWMARGNFTWGEAEWDIGSGFVRFDDPNAAEIGTDIDGGLFGESGGSGKGEMVMQTTWSANLTGMYQVAPDRPWGFNVATNLNVRRGTPLPYYITFTGSDGRNRAIRVVDQIDDFVTDDMFTVDLHLDKEFGATDRIMATINFDLFNAMNEQFVQQRERQLDISSADFLRETLAPRIWRLGLSLEW